MQIIKALKLRGPVGPLVFFFLSFFPVFAQDLYNSALTNALNDHLYDHPQWKSLLHLHKNKNDIGDPAFYINGKYTSAREEFINSFNFLYLSGNPQNICRFPARAFWIEEKLSLPKSDFSVCSELQSFIQKAPIDSIAVVFASENLTSPTSMMGHIFLKIAGLNSKGENIEHSISYFTNLQNISFPELAFKSLITGMKGYYSLSSYAIQKNTYLFNDQRNIWEYELNLNEEQRKLIQLHFYELKPIAFTYYFHFFNCATLIDNIAAVAFPEIKEDRLYWVTPLDVVRSLKKRNLVAQTHVFPANKWLVKSLLESFPFKSETTDLISLKKYDELKIDHMTDQEKFVTWKLSQGYNDFLFENNAIAYNEWSSTNQLLQSKKDEVLPGGALELTHFKRPADTPQDSQLLMAFAHRQKKNIFQFGFMPASHNIEDNTSQYNNESELKLGQMIFAYFPDEKQLKIDQLIIYSASIYSPHTALVNTYSGRFNIGYALLPNTNAEFDHEYFLEGGFGKTLRFRRDVDIYILGNTGIKQNQQFSFFVYPEAGAFIREVWNMKTIVSFSRFFFLKDRLEVNQYKIIQAFNYSNIGFDLKWIQLHRKKTTESFSFEVKYLF